MSDNIQRYLKMWSDCLSPQQKKLNVPEFILKFGQEFQTGPDTYAGKRMRMHYCYNNAGDLALSGEGTYVEGFATTCGIPIPHAWIVDDTGLVRDPTLRKIDEPRDYFGVPFNTDYLRRRVLHTKYWGLLQDYIDLGLLTGETVDFLATVKEKAE